MSGSSRSSSLTVLVVSLVLTTCSTDGESVITTQGDPEPVPVVVDGDFGPDDMMALLYLLERPDVEVLAVTVSGTGLVHCPDGANNAKAILRYLGHEDIPVACGAQTPTEGSHGFPDEWRSGSDTLTLDLGLDPIEEPIDDAVELLGETFNRSDRPTRLLVLGPLTNVAMALEADPTMAENIADVTIMGGAFAVNGSVAPDFEAEWNIWVDPAAANRVLAAGIPVSMIPLDATNDVPATPFFQETLGRVRETPEAELVYHFFETRPYNLEGGSYFFWDPLAAVALIEPEVVTFEDLDVAIDHSSGKTTVSDDGVAVKVATSADRRAFEEQFLGTLNGGRTVTADIPDPNVIVTYSGESCTWETAPGFEATRASTDMVIELLNETETPFAVVAGTHDGTSWQELQVDAETYQQTGIPPDYWTETGSVGIYGRSITGGATTGAFDLEPGTHALVCTDERNQLWLLTDVAISP